MFVDPEYHVKHEPPSEVDRNGHGIGSFAGKSIEAPSSEHLSQRSFRRPRLRHQSPGSLTSYILIFASPIRGISRLYNVYTVWGIAIA